MLSKYVRFYVPSTKNVGEKLSRAERHVLITRVERFMENHFEGFTSIQGKGGWKGIRESVTLVTSYHALETSDALAIVIPLAEAIKAEYRQEAIAIETELGLESI